MIAIDWRGFYGTSTVTSSIDNDILAEKIAASRREQERLEEAVKGVEWNKDDPHYSC
jgi:hypothetical protein